MRLRVAHERIAAIVGNVEPLVSIGGPGVSGFYALSQVMKVGRGCGPSAEGSIYMDPGIALFGDRNQRGEVVVGPGVHISGLQQDDGW